MLNSEYLYSSEDELNGLRKQFINNANCIDPNKKTLLMTTPSHTGTSFWRLLTPLFAMASKYPDLYNYVYVEEANKMSFDLLTKADIWIQHRVGDVHAQYIEPLRKLPIEYTPKIIIHDVDDDEINVPKTHPLRPVWDLEGRSNMAEYQLSEVDYITTTTSNLKNLFHKYNKPENIKIFRNAIDFRQPQWNLTKPAHDKLTIGWAGMNSHMGDIKKMSRILKVIHDKRPDVNFVIAGISDVDESLQLKVINGKPTYIKVPITDKKETYRYKLEQLFNDFDKTRIKFLGVLSLAEYAKFYTMWDINLAYIEETAFNKRKSEIKVVEGAYYDNVNVYSNFGGYNEFLNLLPSDLRKLHLQHCAINSENIDIWVNSILFWIDNYNTDLRKKLVEETKTFVVSNYDIFNQIDKRIEFYAQTLAKSLKVNSLV